MIGSEIRIGKEGAATRWRRLLAYRQLHLIALAVFAADRVSKIWISRALPLNPWHDHAPGSDMTIVPGFLYFIHIGNTGAAWSMFSGQTVLLATLAALTLGAIFWWRHTLGLRARGIQVAFGLAVGGIIGNLVDRLAIGHVVDFIDLHFGSYVYPTFNIADSGICVGVIFYIWMTWRQRPVGPAKVN